MFRNINLFYHKFILFQIIIFLLFVSVHNYILINLKKFENENNSINNEYTPSSLIKNLYNQYYTILNVGNPPQKTEAQISIEDVGLIMKEDICLTSYYYDKSKSLSLYQTHIYDKDNYSKETVIVNETIDFQKFNSETNDVSVITIPDYSFIYNKTNNTREEGEEEKIEKEKSGKACIILGLKLFCKRNILFCKSIPSFLKERKYINTYSFNFLFNNIEEKENEYDASIIIGENPHEYNKEKYNENNYITTKALEWIQEPKWILEFQNYYYDNNGSKIFFKTNSLKNSIKGLFMFNLDIIIGVKSYLDSIKKNYFNNYEKECSINIVNNNYTVITCDKNFNTNDFPTLFFFHNEYNFTFELTDKDLFQIKGDKKFFLIVFDKNSNYPWKFGKLFMKKYFFNFEVDQKLIGFYNNLNNTNSIINKKGETNSNSKFLWLFWALLLIFTGIGCFLLGKFVYAKNRKKRANELEDDYEYTQKNNEEGLTTDSNGNKLGIN